MRRHLGLFIIFVWQALFCVALADGNLIYEQCFINKVAGTKIGYSTVEQKYSKYKNQDVILTHKYTEQQFKRFGLPISIVQDINFYEDKNANPVFLEVSSKTGEDVIKYTVDFLPNNKVLITTLSDITQPKELLTEGGILFPYGIEKLFREKSAAPVVEYTTIDPESGFKTIKVKAVKNGAKYDVSFDILPNIKNEQWRDINGHIVKDYSSVLDLEQIAAAKSDIFTNLADEFQKGKIPADGNIDNIKNVKEITYKLDLGSYVPANIPVFLSSQRIIQSKDNIVYLKVKHRNYGNQAFKYPPVCKNSQDALKPTFYMDYQDAGVKALLDSQLVDAPKDSYKFAKKLEKYVNQEITLEKNKTNVKKASQTFAGKSGDLTDRAILLAALLRRAKIPAKVMVGVKYTASPETCFSYYCWVVANLGNEWVTLDCNSNMGNVSTVDYIALADADFALNKSVEDLFLAYLKKLSDMKITFLDFSLLENSMPSEIESKVKISDMGFLDYIKNSGMTADDIDYQKNSPDNREFWRLSHIESKKYMKKAYTSYTAGDIDDAVLNFNQAFELTPVNDDYMNVDYANKLVSLGLFSFAKSRLANISDYQIWESKVELLYKMYLPKDSPEFNDEKKLATILSKASYNPASIDLNEIKTSFSDKKYKNSDYVNYVLAKAYFAKNDIKKADFYINKAIGINPDNNLYKILKINILSSKGSYTSALRILDELLDGDDNINDRELSYGMKLHKYYLLSKKAKKPEEKNYYMARFYLMSDRDDKAKELVVSNTKTRNSELDYDLLGRIYFNDSDIEHAKEAYNKALSINKKDVTAIEGLGNLSYLNQDYNDALKNYRHALEYLKNSDKLMFKIANCYREMSDDNSALEAYTETLRLNPRNYAALFNIAEIKGKYENDNSRAVYKQVLSINPNYSAAWIGLVKLALIEKNPFLARQYLMCSFHIDERNPVNYYYSGLIEIMDENYSYARRDFNMALRLNPNFTPAKVELEKLK